MKNKYLLTGVTFALLAAGGMGIYNNSIDQTVVRADSQGTSTLPYSNTLVRNVGDGLPADTSITTQLQTGLSRNGISQVTKEDYGNGDDGGYLQGFDNHIFNSKSSSQATYRIGLNKKVTYKNLTISPTKDATGNQSVPLIVDAAVYVDGDNVSPLTLTHNGDGTYTADLSNISPTDDNGYILYAIQPLQSSDNGDNSLLLHRSAASDFLITGTDNGQTVADGSDYTSDHSDWGTLWGVFDNFYLGGIDGLKSQTSITTGDTEDIGKVINLDSGYYQRSDISVFVRDSIGKSVQGDWKVTSNLSSLPAGTYYVTIQQTDGANTKWDTSIVTIKNPTPSPTPQPVQQGTQVTHYVDQNGKKIAPDETQTGNVGDSYSTIQKSIDGYTFDKVIGNAFGTYANGTLEVTYVYSESNTEPNPGDGKVAVKGAAVYAIKKIGLYKNPNFKNNNRIKWYLKEKRVNRPEFIVKGYYRNKQGTLRYRVQQYNPYTRKYVKGTNGYITTAFKYVVPAYYSSLPKGKRVIVINHSGVNSYKNISLTKKAKNFKRGTQLQVKKVVKFKYATRYLLANGQYVTANKKFVIANAY